MLIGDFNETYNNTSFSYLKVGDESMSVIRFWNTENRNLPPFSYIFQNPEPLGKEFNTVAYSITGDLLLI